MDDEANGSRILVSVGGWTSCAIDILDKLHCWGPPERANLGAPEDYLIGLDGYFRQETASFLFWEIVIRAKRCLFVGHSEHYVNSIVIIMCVYCVCSAVVG